MSSHGNSASALRAGPAFVPGLEGVAAAETVLSHVDGAAGRLIVCGHELEDFVARQDFEAAAARLWAAAAGEPEQGADALGAALGTGRAAAFERYVALGRALDGLPLADGLRLAVAAMPETADAHVAVTAAIPVFAANLARRAAGRPPVEPDPAASHVADFLRMLRGAAPGEADVDALRVYLLTVMDHGMNASTFTARVVASTGAGLVGAVVAAYAALTGPLHGGAPEPVLDMLDAIGTPERAERWIDDALARGERLMGFGHRIYKVRDPRADVLKRALERLDPSDEKLALGRAVEAAAVAALRRHKPGRKLETNVEFYTAMLLDALGIPRAAFTPVFAVGRVVGWTAHALEQRRGGRLIRPASIYVGRVPIPMHPPE